MRVAEVDGEDAVDRTESGRGIGDAPDRGLDVSRPTDDGGAA